MRKSLPLLILILIALAGCSSKQASQPSQTVANNEPAGAAPSKSPSDASSSPSSTDTSEDGKASAGTKADIASRLPPEVQKELKKQKQNDANALRIPANNTQNWTASDVTPLAIAEDIEKSVPQLRNTYAHVTAVVKTPDGTGDFNQEAKIKDPQEYVVPFIAVGMEPLPAKICSNGALKMLQLGDNWEKPISVSAPMHVPPAPGLTPALERDITQFTFEPVTHLGGSWPDAIKHLMDPSQGYRVSVESRTLPYKQYFYRNFRIHAVRSDEAATRLGKSEVEIVGDGYHSLPVTIRTSYTDPSGKRSWNLSWNCSYQAGQKFKAKDFEAPYNAKIKSA